MTAQLDLFAPEAVAEDRRCGLCVHRNAVAMAPRGYCTPGGWTAAGQAGCAWWFGRDEMRRAIGARTPK